MRHDQSSPSSLYLTHKYASFHGCTLAEMFMILGVWLALECVVMIIIAIVLGHYVGGFLGAMLLQSLLAIPFAFFVLTQYTAKWIGRMRVGRPAGYLKLRTRLWLHEVLGVSLVYVFVKERSVWITQRTNRTVTNSTRKKTHNAAHTKRTRA